MAEVTVTVTIEHAERFQRRAAYVFTSEFDELKLVEGGSGCSRVLRARAEGRPEARRIIDSSSSPNVSEGKERR